MEAVWKEMYEAAKAVQNPRRVSDYVDAGGVAAAVLSESGRIYTGVCVDTCCTLGICAERNAIFRMLTQGEHRISRVLAIMPDGYPGIEILTDYENETITTLGALTPQWWTK